MTDRPSDRAIAQAPNEDALIALFESVYEREWDRAAEESDDRRKAILGPADEHATRMAVRAVVAAAAPDGAQAEIVGWLYSDGKGDVRLSPRRWISVYVETLGLTESPLYTAPPSLDAEDAADSLMEAISCAARDLPDGWQIEIGVECGAGWVNLYEDGRHVGLELSTDDSLEEQVRDSIAFAIDAARAAEGGERG